MTRSFKLSAMLLALASPTMPGAIQTAAFAQAAQPAPAATPPGTTAAPVAMPAPVWRRSAAEELLGYIEGIEAEGLDPAAYEPDRLRAALSSGDDGELTPVASRIFLKLTADLSGGQVRGDARVDWYIADTTINGNQQQLMLAQAARGGVAELLDSLHPVHPQYASLKRALAMTAAEDTARRDLIRANMERWRWMPRSLGARHVIVNVPAFTAAVVDNGAVTVRHRTVVGARRTPTPQLSATISAVTLNPWWNVPQSIVREMGGRFGGDYVVRREGNYTIARQRPGPRNALGRVKIEMANNHAIYLHDTPAQALFARPVRAFSHGCIRTQNVRDFAAVLLAPTGGWDRASIDAGIDAGRTQSVQLAEPIPVYIAYFTAAATNDGNIVTYADIYGRDTPVRQALNRVGGQRTEVASR
jgi:murein L,D-transpeptidase YcbB/YkuD